MERRKLIFINSADRISGTPSMFKIVFPDNLIKAAADEYMVMRLNEFVTNFSFYAVQTFNNTFSVHEVDHVGATFDNVIVIPVGNYNINTISAKILAVLNSSPFYSYTMVNAEITDLWTFEATPFAGINGSITFNFSNPAFIESAAELLGFDQANYNFTPIAGPRLELVSIGTANLNAEENLFLRVDSLIYDNIEFARATNSWGPSNIIGKIPILTPPFSKVNYIDINNNYEVIIDKSSITELNVSITNENNNIINLNNQDYSFSVLFTFRKKKSVDMMIIERLDRIIGGLEQLTSIIRSDVLLRHPSKNKSRESDAGGVDSGYEMLT